MLLKDDKPGRKTPGKPSEPPRLGDYLKSTKEPFAISRDQVFEFMVDIGQKELKPDERAFLADVTVSHAQNFLLRNLITSDKLNSISLDTAISFTDSGQIACKFEMHRKQTLLQLLKSVFSIPSLGLAPVSAINHAYFARNMNEFIQSVLPPA
ncbi:MAG: hypothetical protein JXK16_06320 [Thiotrichales bacterium]|nr:hypothetical protein [Thiotrichales bacterium]